MHATVPYKENIITEDRIRNKELVLAWYFDRANHCVSVRNLCGELPEHCVLSRSNYANLNLSHGISAP